MVSKADVTGFPNHPDFLKTELCSSSYARLKGVHKTLGRKTFAFSQEEKIKNLLHLFLTLSVALH